MVPLVIREWVGGIEAATIGRPDLDRGRINEPVLNGVVLADQTDAITSS